MQFFSADAMTFFKKIQKKFASQNMKKLHSKVAHNPTRPNYDLLGKNIGNHSDDHVFRNYFNG